jgi:hypothetical protein
MSIKQRPNVPLQITEAQRKTAAELLPELADRMRLDEPNQRVVVLQPDEVRRLALAAARTLRHRLARSGFERNSVRHLLDATKRALAETEGLGAIAVRERLYQFRIGLQEIQPSIWRRIQVRDCTLDRLHTHIQTAMGWTNSHLHRFEIAGAEYVDPWLIRREYDDEPEYRDTREVRLSQVLPPSGERFLFHYEYDFGDSWNHDVLFEGCLRAEPGVRYPLCIEGERACPPEDVGGVSGYAEFVEAMTVKEDKDPKEVEDEYANTDEDEDDEVAEQCRNWYGRPFDPAAFDADATTRRMRRGLPDWRKVDSRTAGRRPSRT